jgi:hypothetical protein
MTQSVRKCSWLTSIATASALFLQPFAARSEGWTSVQQPSTPQSPLQWSTPQRDNEASKPKGVTWSSINFAPDKETTSETAKPPNRSLVWQPLEPGDVITEDDIVPLSDLEGEQVIAIERPPAYSRGSMIQIGETVYPNLGFNALQRHPNSWVNAAVVAIDDSRIGNQNCETGNFVDECADGMLEARVRMWNSPALSFDLHWTMHSLSGEGSPFNFIVGDQTFGSGDVGTKFGEGQSIGFVLSKNFGNTFGMTLAGYRLLHFDETTDLPRNFALFGTKVFQLNNSIEPPIISLSLGLMTDVFNSETNIGTVGYPKSLRGGLYPSLFADYFDSDTSGYVYYDDVAGVSSAFVCADNSIFAGKPITAVNGGCLQQVYVGPIASIGFAPWPWLGMYAKYSGTDIDLGISLKPFKDIPWTLSLEALNPIKGVNPDLDASFDFKECRNRENASFSDCRTRVGIYTELAF